jgi:hypothetical protein
MSRQDLIAGRRWVERRFEEIAPGVGAPRGLALGDRWRESSTFEKHDHSMAYYTELGGHLTRGELTLLGRGLEMLAQASQQPARSSGVKSGMSWPRVQPGASSERNPAHSPSSLTL